MKIKQIKKITATIVALLAVAVTYANASTTAQIEARVKTAFKGVKTMELTPTAAQLVRQASATDKEQTAIAVVRTVIEKRPNLAAQVVSAVTYVAPQTAPAVAAEASKLAKSSSEEIAVAAVKVAPEQADPIIQRVSEAVPSSSAKVTARVRTTMRSASTPASGGNPETKPGRLNGTFDQVPPTTTLVSPVNGFDPKRYQSP